MQRFLDACLEDVLPAIGTVLLFLVGVLVFVLLASGAIRLSWMTFCLIWGIA